MAEQPFDLNELLSQAMEMQQRLASARDEVAHTVVEGRSGGGAVVVEVTGAFEFRAVRIRPEAVDPDDVELLQDLLLSALRDAVARIAELQAESVGGVGAALGGGLGGLLGSGAQDVIDVDDTEEDDTGEIDTGRGEEDGDAAEPGGDPGRGDLR